MRVPRMTTRRLSIAVAAVALAFSAEAAITVMALLVLIRVLRRPRPVHLLTAILLTLLAGILLWANLRPTRWQEEWGGGIEAPAELDPISKAMFWRGWPLAPLMICADGLRFRHLGNAGCALVFDGVVFLFALFAAKAVCEGCFRWRRPAKVARQSNSD